MYVHKLSIYDCILYFLISIIILSGTVSISIWYTSCTSRAVLVAILVILLQILKLIGILVA